MCLFVCMWCWSGKERQQGTGARCRPACWCKYVRLSDEDTIQDAICLLIQCCVGVGAYMSVFFVFEHVCMCVFGINVLYVWVSACLIVCPWQRAAGI